jgi:FKBP-type peptidyl-prolyl cis-trans isomerase FkpA
MKKIVILIYVFAASNLIAQEKFKTGVFAGYEMDENCVYTKFYPKRAIPLTPKEGDLLRVQMQYRTSSDSLLYSSDVNNLDKVSYIEFPLGKPTFHGGVETALETMRVGDTASFLINADSIFLRSFGMEELPPFIKKGDVLKFEVRLLKITTKEELEKRDSLTQENAKLKTEIAKLKEGADIINYITKNNIAIKPLASGLYYIEKTKGKGKKVVKGSTVKMNYVARFLDGTIFDTNDTILAKQANLFDPERHYEPFEFKLGEGAVIPGVDEGASMMSVGSKVQLIIPSALAYGEQGTGPIKGYSPLLFEIELLSSTPPEGTSTK